MKKDAISAVFIVCSVAPLPVFAQIAPSFDRCETIIRTAEKEGRISYEKQQHLLEDLHEMRVLDDQYVAAHWARGPGKVFVPTQHDPSVAAKVRDIIAQLDSVSNLRAPVTPAAQRCWPPRDASGKIVLGPRTSGTREQMGWPLYGWSQEDRLKYTLQK